MTPEEMKELMYKPLPGEWGVRNRDEECERIVAGISQLISLGACTATRPYVRLEAAGVSGSAHPHYCTFLPQRDCSSVLWSRGLGPVSHLLHCDRLSHRSGHH